MDRHETASKLSSLIRLDEAAEQAYLHAAPKVPDTSIASVLVRIGTEHARQAEDIRQVLRSMGEPQRARSAEFEAYVDALLAGIRQARRPVEVMTQTREAQATVLVLYADAAETPLPLQARRLVRRHLVREEAYLETIDAICFRKR